MDSNYFQKIFLKQEQSISKAKSKTLAELDCDLKSFGAYSLNNHVEYLDDGVPFIRGINLKKGRITFNDVIYISNEAHKLLWKSEVRPKTILLSMSGTIGDVAIASESLKYPINSNQDVAKIYCSEQLNPYYLYTFLRSYFGQNYLIREARGSVQQHVFLSQIEKFQIPEFSTIFDKAIESLVKNADLSDSHSKQCYEKSENLLLETLGMADFSPSAEKVNIKSFKDSFAATSRLDAEYYQLMFEDIEAKISSKKHARLDDLVSFINHGKQPPYVEGGTVRVFSQKWIGDKSIDYSFLDATDEPFTSQDFACQYSDFVAKTNDIVYYSVGANLGYCHNYLANEPFMPGSFITLIRADGEKINPIYLGVALNSSLGRMQAEKRKSASAQPYIYPKDISEFLIPIVDIETQTKIAALVQQSFSLKAESERLLEAAKHAVEISIETNEDAALAWLASIH